MRPFPVVEPPLARYAAKHFRLAVEGKVATVTLNRPERKNPLTFESYDELRATFYELDHNYKVKAVVLRGVGGNFCSGGDVHEIIGPLTKMNAQGLLKFTRMTGDLVRAMRACPQPIIAAVEGVCAGAGAILAMASDIRFGQPGCKTAFLFSRVGPEGAELAGNVMGSRKRLALALGVAENQVVAECEMLLGLIPDDAFKFCWIVDFPMFEYDEEAKKIDFSHNPFSMPQGGLEALETNARDYYNRFSRLAATGDVPIQDRDNREATERARVMMERQMRQMVRLIDDLLDLSRITRGKIELRKERVDLANVIQNAVETSRPLIELQAELERLMQRIGLDPEGRKFTPHVTLARLHDASSQDVADYLSVRGYFPSQVFTADRFVLFSSRASTGGGPYVVEDSYELCA